MDEPDERTTVKAFRIGLPIDDEFTKSLYREILKSLDRLMKRIKLECILEEDITKRRKERLAPIIRDTNPRKEPVSKRLRVNRVSKALEKDNPERAFMGITTAFNIPIYKILPQIKDQPYFLPLAPMQGDSGIRDRNGITTIIEIRAT